MANSMVSMKKIKIGGIDQWIYIRTKDVNNPIVLFLHGGPGNPSVYVLREFQEPLEKHFNIVQWEQRGSGKSYSKKIPKESLNVNQFILDLHELINYLLKRFNKKKVFLIGHSWGSLLGVLTVKKYPELFYAYIGIGQLVNPVESEKKSYELVLNKAIEYNDKKAIEDLKQIGKPFDGMKPPYKTQYKGGYKARLRFYGWLAKFGGVYYDVNYFTNKKRYLYEEFEGKILFYLPFFIKEYSIIDKYKRVKGGMLSMQAMTEEILKIDLKKDVPSLNVPVFFMLGRHDMNVPSVLAEDYFNNLKAPQKELIYFEKSSHLPNAEEAKKFNRLFVEKILPLAFEK